MCEDVRAESIALYLPCALCSVTLSYFFINLLIYPWTSRWKGITGVRGTVAAALSQLLLKKALLVFTLAEKYDRDKRVKRYWTSRRRKRFGRPQSGSV